MLRWALRSGRDELKSEDDVDDGSMEQFDETDKDNASSVPRPSPVSVSSSSLCLSVMLSEALKAAWTDRLGIVNCGMLSGVSIFMQMFSRLVWNSDLPGDFALLVAHKSARIPALLCLRAVEKSSA